MQHLLKVIIFIGLLFNSIGLTATDKKGKLYFEGTRVLVSANQSKQTDFIAKIDKTIDAELFASRIMPFIGDKEKKGLKDKLSKCINVQCVLSTAGKEGVAVFVRSEVAFLPDSFKGTLKMYETSNGTLLTEVSKIGNLKNSEKEYSEMVKAFVLQSTYYFNLNGYAKSFDDFKSFQITPFSPVVGFKTFSVPRVNDLLKPKEFTSNPPEKMTSFHELSNIKSRKLITLYEEALKADRLGESKPLNAMNAWKKVSETATGEIKEFAVKRLQEWHDYNTEIIEAQKIKKIWEKEKEFVLFPGQALKLWQDFITSNPSEKRKQIAQERISFYTKRYAPVKKYIDERTSLLKKGKAVHDRNIKAVGNKTIKLDRKIDMFLNFLKKYGSVDDDFNLLESFINNLPTDKEKGISRKNIYNKWISFFYQNKCENNDSQACIIAEQISRKINDDNIAIRIQEKGCKNGILELCASLAQTKLASLNDPELKTLAEKSCAMGSAKGCIVLSNFYKVAVNEKPKAKKDLLNKVGCKRGYLLACKGEINITENAAIAKPETPSKKLGMGKAKPGKISVKPKEQQGRNSFLKTHPYFWYGLSSGIASAALGGVAVYYGVKMNNSYKDYNASRDMFPSIINESDDSKRKFIEDTNQLLYDGDKYKKIAIGTGIAGGTLFVTGIILMAIKKPALENKTQLTFIPSKSGFMVGASFNY